MSNLVDKVNNFLIEVTEDDFNNTVAKNNLAYDVGDTTPTVFQENMHKVVVPTSMSKIQGASNLLKQFKEEETPRIYNRSYPNIFMNDFMVIMNKIILDYFGMIHVSQVNTSFKPAGSDYIQIPTEYRNGQLQYEKGYVGSVIAPIWEDAIIDIHPTGALAIRAKLKFEDKVNAFLAKIDQLTKTISVVRGKSVTLSSVRGGVMATPIAPKENKKIVLSEENERLLANIIIPSLGDKAKTSLLFTGDFGTL